MNSQTIKLLHLYLPALFICMLLISACENSLNDIQKIASKEENKPISRSTGVDVIYSDSAKVKAHMTAPLMIEYADTPKPYKEMPKGVKIIFYDADLKESGNIVSDYAVQRDKENIIEFRKNVVATNAQGQVFKSEELIYDMNTKKMYSTKAVEIVSPKGDVVDGIGFDSNETFYPWHIVEMTGAFHVNEKDVK
ncbi:LPS export ABC transporter periplasmic protein LptC [Mucilaginibacter sp. OK098]|uniref:LPS export ABC transporter periplasmic protein LptC n=1 Tax=Mucilaginibacter sp. OK098 TaxID=1855297 RepID=UPI0009213F38|nr:LPS export ABC transporter periplasmic protein LptC [Mucilaginibacter sp. OK098]SHN18123.1 LPS export ABC transporter protein LptC [Mucilaginibacter sp. OK098]